jgi:tubulin beta
VGFAPLSSIASKTFEPLNVAQITSQLFDPRNLMISCDTRLGKYLTASCMFRGDVSTKEVDKHMAQILYKNPTQFVPWVPNNITSSVCNIPPVGMKLSATFIANSTAIQHVFERTKSQFTKMFRKKAFLHWYIDEGMDELEFSEAESNINDLISEYQQYQEAGIDVPSEEFVDNNSVVMNDEESESETVFTT